MTRPKRVAMVLRRYDAIDGVASHVGDLSKALRDSGYEVVVFTGQANHTGTASERYHTFRGHVDGWVTDPTLSSRRPTWSSVRSLSRSIKEYAPDLLHAHGLGVTITAKLAGRLTGRPVVSTAHPSRLNLERASKTAGYRKAVGFLTPWIGADRAIAISDGVADSFLRGAGYPKSRIRTVYNGVDVSHFRPPTEQERAAAREAIGLAPDDFGVVVAGRLDPGKRLDVALQALAVTRRNGINCQAMIAGGRGNTAEVERLAASFGEDSARSTRVLGFVPDLRDVYWASDLMVFASRYEGFGLVSVEAMACGVVPVRVKSWGAEDQIVDGVHGRLCEIDDVKAIAECVEQLASDRDLLATMSTAAANRARSEFSCQVMARDTIAVYEELLPNAPTQNTTP